VRHGFAAHRLDLVAHRTRRALVLARAVGGDAEVVHDDARTEPRQLQRVTAAEPGGSAGDAIGAALACWASWRIAFWPFVVLEGTWFAVAVIALLRPTPRPG